MSNSYRDLIVWQKALALVTDLYRATESFPAREMYGLTSQIRRAAVSVTSNIAEGQGRNSRGEFVQFLGHSRGSLYEIETQLSISANLGYITTKIADELLLRCDAVSRLINGLMQSLVTRTKASVEKRETRN